MFLYIVAALILFQSPLTAQTGCPAINFATGVETYLYSRDDNTVSGLQRQTDGSLTAIRYRYFNPFTRMSTTANAQNSLYNCTTLGARTPSALSTPPLGDEVGVSSRNPLITNLKGNGTPSILVIQGRTLAVHFHDVAIPNSPETQYTIPADGESMVVGDFNGDGKRDVAVIHDTQNGTVSVLLGNGDGTLRAPVSYAVGSYSQNATAYDFNGDGRTDLAVTNGNSANISILLAKADGTFQAAVNYPCANLPNAPLVADVTGDGKPDLVVGGFGTSIGVLRGNGDGTFQTATLITTTMQSRYMAAGDFNRDGKIDLAIVDSYAGRIGILLGAGNGTFTLTSSYVVRYDPNNVIVTDFDRDGIPDVVIGGGHPDALSSIYFSDSPLQVFIGAGDGTFYGAPTYTVVASPNDFLQGDFNSDGKLDLAVAANAGIDILLGQGGGRFAAAVRAPGGGCCVTNIATGDFNKDGKLDLVATDNAQSKIRVLLGNGNGTFQNPVTYPAGTKPRGVTVGDVNGDGNPDLIVGQAGNGTAFLSDMIVFLGNSNGTFGTGTALAGGTNPSFVVLRDLNNDGKLDLIIANEGIYPSEAGDLMVRLGNGNGTFQPAVRYPAGSYPKRVTLGDVNGDGKLDMVVPANASNGGYQIAILTGKGDGTFNAVSASRTDFGPADVAIADFSGDGKADLIVAHCCGDVDITFSVGNGDGTFQSEQHVAASSPSRLIQADFDANGSPDLAVLTQNNGESSFVSVYVNVRSAASACTYTLDRNSAAAAAGGETLAVTVTASQPSCSWNATSDSAWATFSGTLPRTGSGTLNIVAAANTGAARSANLTIAGRTFTLSQAVAGCSFTLSPGSLAIPSTGGDYTVAVTASGANCAWSATSPDSWITITSGATGTGNGVVGLRVVAYAGATSRFLQLTIGGRSFTVTQFGTQTSGLRFVPLDPCRVMETRAEYNFQGRTGSFGPPALTQAETRTLNLPQSNVCQIPSSAKAYVVNVTLVPRGGVDFVTVWPAGEARPTFWTVRSPDGQIVANSSIVKAGTNGGISVYSSNATDMIIDISGYFTDNPATPGYTYYPLTPCRVLDTRALYRSPAGPFGPPTMNAGERRSFQFPAATQYCQVPQGAKAYSITITVAPPGPLQFLTAWPTGGGQPNVSSINSAAGRTLANTVIVPASATGSIDAFVFDQSDVLMDITGYFSDDNGQGLFYVPVTQCRVHESQFTDEQAKTIAVPGAAGCSGIPPAAKGYMTNVTAIPGGNPMPFITAYPTGQNRPNASILNAFQGQTVTNSAIVPTGVDGSIDVFAYRRTNVVVELSGYFVR